MKKKELLKQKLKLIFPQITSNDKLYYLFSLITNFDGREHCIKNKQSQNKKKIYIIRPRKNNIEGLMSIFIYIIQRIDYAIRFDMVPIIDMKNYYSQYYDGVTNAWEWFFQQPTDYKLSDVYKDNKIILSGYTWKNKINKKIGSSECMKNGDISRYCYEKLIKKIKFSDEVINLIKKEEKRICPERCIGVYIRGTDYVALKPVGEPVQPKPDDVIKRVKEFCALHQCNHIFLVTEDMSIYKKFKSVFGEKIWLCSFDKFIDNYHGDTFLGQSGVLEENIKEWGINYLVKIIILSKCRYFVGSITRGSIAAFCFNGDKFVDKYVFDLGTY